MVERFHQKLKESLKARCCTENWSEEMYRVSLGIRNSLKKYIGYTPAQLVYGQELRFSDELIVKCSGVIPLHLSQNYEIILIQFDP